MSARWIREMKDIQPVEVDGIEYFEPPTDQLPTGITLNGEQEYRRWIASEAARLGITPRRGEASTVYMCELSGAGDLVPPRLRRRVYKIGTTNRTGESRINEFISRLPYEIVPESVLIVQAGAPHAMLRESAAKEIGLPIEPELRFSGYTDCRLLTKKMAETCRSILIGQ